MCVCVCVCVCVPYHIIHFWKHIYDFFLAHKIADALHYLHTSKPSISHSAMKPENIMLNEYNQAKLVT